VVAKEAAKKEENVNGRKKKNGEKAKFWPTFINDFFSLHAWNLPLFIGGGIGIIYLYWCQILTLDLNRKDHNR
jgi:hypothetical protein